MNFENAMQPLFEKITDPTEELYVQDMKGRIFKIVLCEGDQLNLDEVKQNFENEEPESGYN